MTPTELEARRWQDLGIRAGAVFTPTSPIDERSLFAGREEQVRLVVDAINQKGQHAILYGERGVGKTSLANVLSSFLGDAGGQVIAPRVNCDATDTFPSVWQKVFEQIELTRRQRSIGFSRESTEEQLDFAQMLGDGELTPDTVRRALTMLAQGALPILIIDEFDRLAKEPRHAFADTIKSLSDHAVRATVVVVGVADSVDGLIQEHASIERGLVQIRMPRMQPEEINQILVTGLTKLGMTWDAAALTRIARLAQGLPHYAHLLGLYASRAAIDSRQTHVDQVAVAKAIERAIEGSQQSVRGAYDVAVRSQRRDSLFADVLLACALAEKNELGYFAAQDVRGPLRRITGKVYGIPAFAQHLNEFCDEKRGPILDKSGAKRLFRYRFRNPLVQPFVIMKGIGTRRISSEILD